MKKKLMAFIITCVMITGVISSSYMQSRAMATVGAVDVIYTILLALGVKTDINLKQIDDEGKRVFVQSVVQSFNQKEQGLGTELQTFAESAIRYGVTATLSVQQTLWNRLLSATTTTDGLNFETTEGTSANITGFNQMLSYFVGHGWSYSELTGANSTWAHSMYDAYASNNESINVYEAELFGNKRTYAILGGKLVNNSGALAIQPTMSEQYYFVWLTSTGSTLTVGQWNFSIGIVNNIANGLGDLEQIGSTNAIVKTVVKHIPSVFETIKRANMYDVATKGRLWDSQSDTMSGDVVLTIPATGVADISESVSSETDTLESAQAKIGAKAVNKAQGITITDSIPIEDAITDQTEIYDSDINNYTLSLTSFFPFCIPWDIYDMLSAFVAEPETPSFVFNFPTGVINHQIQWTECIFDLHQWDGVAQGMRVLETISFTIGLAMITRNYFLRG